MKCKFAKRCLMFTAKAAACQSHDGLNGFYGEYRRREAEVKEL